MNPLGLASSDRPIPRDNGICSYTKIRNCAASALLYASGACLAAGYFAPSPFFKGILVASSAASVVFASTLLSPSYFNEAEKIKAFLETEKKELLTPDLTLEGFEHFANHNLVNADFICAIRACIKADRDDLAEIILNVFLSRPVDGETTSFLASILNMCATFCKTELVSLILTSYPELLNDAADTAFRESIRLNSKSTYQTLSILLSHGPVSQGNASYYLLRAVNQNRPEIVDLILSSQEVSQDHKNRCLMIAAENGNIEIVHLLLKKGDFSNASKEKALKKLLSTLPKSTQPLQKEFFKSLFKTTSLLKLLAINNNFYQFFPDTWKSKVKKFYQLNKAVDVRLTQLESSPFQINPNGSNAQQIPPIPVHPDSDRLDKLRLVLDIVMHNTTV